MNILLTNDDGYSAQGIICLAKHLVKEHNVTVIAPKHEMSGASHSVSFFSGISYEEIDCENGLYKEAYKNSSDNGTSLKCFAVDGKPADCVIFGIKHLLRNEEIDLVFSGINDLLNLGTDYIYSGTVGAAQEATYLRHKGIAVSLELCDKEAANSGSSFDAASDFILKNISAFYNSCKENITLNINIPNTDFNKIKGVRATQIAYRPYEEYYIKRRDKHGDEKYYVAGRPYPKKDSGDDDDATHLENGYITITPIRLFSSCNETIKNMQEVFFKL